MSEKYELEVCVSSANACREAELGGASRVELCAGMAEGGTTPSAGLMMQARKSITIPMHVIIRSREGDFCYSSSEMEEMLYDIEVARKLGADGIVWGGLNPDGSLDKDALREVLRATQGLSFTFHRAFDVLEDRSAALEELISFGVNRVLTSGGHSSALSGSDELAALVRQAKGRIGIMAGSGVRPDNILQIAKSSGCRMFHGSFRGVVRSIMTYRNPEVAMGSGLQDEYERLETNAGIVAEAKAELDAFWG